ncbi:hypothetical protein AD930_02390 [Acetobacter malorum]|nr:hypothetical protein AD930_02390 [Acetobacter malorum]
MSAKSPLPFLVASQGDKKKVVCFIPHTLFAIVDRRCREEGITRLHCIQEAVNAFAEAVGDTRRISIAISRDHREGGPRASLRLDTATCNRGKFFLGGWVDQKSHQTIKGLSKSYGVTISSMLEWGIAQTNQPD